MTNLHQLKTVAVNCKVHYELHDGHAMEVGTFAGIVVYIKHGNEIVFEHHDVITELTKETEQ